MKSAPNPAPVPVTTCQSIYVNPTASILDAQCVQKSCLASVAKSKTFDQMDEGSQNLYREWLRTELVRRCQANPKYSLRAFSRSLGVQSSFLSKLINGKRAVTERTVRRFEPSVGSPLRSAKKTSHKFENLTSESFRLISDWYHFAILELFTVEGFLPTPTYISRRLGITSVEAKDAILRLEKLGLIRKSLKSGYQLVKGENSTQNCGSSSVDLRKLQRQVLERAIRALDERSFDERDQSTITMAIDSKDIGLAKERIKNFRRNLCSELQAKKKRDSVYQLTIALFPVTAQLESGRKTK